MPKLFSFTEVADLAEMSAATLRDWFAQRPGRDAVFTLAEDDRGASRGGTRLVTPHTTLEVCIAAALTRHGLTLPKAASAGMAFAHGITGFPRRAYPGAIYPGSAVTMMAVKPDGGPKIFRVKAGDDAFQMLTHILDEGAIVIRVDTIARRIEAAA